MPNKLSEIQLWDAGRTGSVTLPKTFRSQLSSQPVVTKSLGKPYSMRFSIRSGSVLATTSSSEANYLSKKKIIRFVYDDASFEEWRIKRVSRQTSGDQDFTVECEPIWQDLAYQRIRHTLSTGVVRNQVNFYSTSVDDILDALFGSDYNGPALFQKGTIDSTIGAKEVGLSFNAASFMEALFEISSKAEAEWDVTWNSGDSKYDINFYEIGDLGGGSGQASTRLIAMGGGEGNRQNLLIQDSEEDYFSRIVPVAGQGNETIGIGGVVFDVNESGGEITFDDDYFPEDGFLLLSNEDLYFGNDSDGWFEVTTVQAPDKIFVSGTPTGITSGRFAIGASKKQMVFMESKDAVDDIGVVEIDYRRTDISPYVNLIKKQGISDDFSTFSSGVPEGTAKVGTPTASEETSDEFVKFGSKSCKVVADTDEGLSWDVEIDNEYPYFSLLTYLKVSAGGIKIEFEDSAGNLVPEGQFAETDQDITQALSMEGAKPASGTATIRVVATEDSTTFYLDACTLTNSPQAQPFQPLMGVYDLWKESARQLNQFGGIQPSEYRGKCWDDAYFDGSLNEIEIGSWVTVKDGWNGTSYDINFTGRILEVSYVEEFGKGRLEKTVVISNRPRDLELFLSNNFVRRSELQKNDDIPFAPSLDALGIAIKEGNITITREGVMSLLAANIGDFEIITNASGTELSNNAKLLTLLFSSLIIGDITQGNVSILARDGITLQSDTTDLVLEALNSHIRLDGLPTTNPGGNDRVWNDSGTLKIT